jgi:hypothetical protein
MVLKENNVFDASGGGVMTRMPSTDEIWSENGISDAHITAQRQLLRVGLPFTATLYLGV